MPITLGCPACGKRFKARDESAGKRVKCPYCGAPVTVPTAEESATAAAPTTAIPPAPSAPGKPSPLAGSAPIPVPHARSAPAVSPPASPPAPAPVATPDDWGAGSSADSKPIEPEPPSLPAVQPPAFPTPPRVSEKSKKVAKAKPEPRVSAYESAPAKKPDSLAAPAWKKTKAGLFWVLFALFFLTIPGFVGFAKGVLPRLGVELPKGEGWVIEGYVNTNDQGAIRMKKEEQIDVLAYAAPVLVAGLALSFGRLTCGAAPQSSGARGVFAFSGLFTFLALVGLVAAGACQKLLFFETYKQAGIGFLIVGSLAEFWFLVGLAASGAVLKRPKAVRSVGLVGFFFALTAAVATLGWEVYLQEWRPKTPDDDWKIAEQGGLMLGWLLLIGVYWRAVVSVRRAIREFLDSVE